MSRSLRLQKGQRQKWASWDSILGGVSPSLTASISNYSPTCPEAPGCSELGYTHLLVSTVEQYLTDPNRDNRETGTCSALIGAFSAPLMGGFFSDPPTYAMWALKFGFPSPPTQVLVGCALPLALWGA